MSIKATISFESPGIKATFMAPSDPVVTLMRYRDDPRMWSIIQLVQEYDDEVDSEEKINIKRTILEIVENEL